MKNLIDLLKKSGKKIIIWGAGISGLKIYDFCIQHHLDVIFFIDKKYKDMTEGLMRVKVIPPPIHDVEIFKKLNAFVMVASVNFYDEIADTLQKMGLEDNLDYVNALELWADERLGERLRNYHESIIKRLTPEYVANLPLFISVEIETHNRCNGVCSFCPVNSKIDPRKYAKMPDELFSSIIDQLAELDYNGRIAPFCNNEPYLDKRIISFLKEIKEKLPKSILYLYTNGTLLTIDKFIESMKYIDLLVIDNYNDDYELIPQVEEIYHYCLKNESVAKKVKIQKCLVNQQLGTRGGRAPNRKKIYVEGITCVNPFRTMVIRPDGKASLCCNDALGEFTLGDLKEQSLLDIWYGKAYSDVRDKLISGRENLSLCSGCDSMMYYVDPALPQSKLLVTRTKFDQIHI